MPAHSNLAITALKHHEDSERLNKQSLRLYKRFARYHAPYLVSILLATACAAIIAFCEVGSLRIFTETIDAFAAISGSTYEEPVVIRYFQIESIFHFEGFEIVLPDAGAALRAILWLLGGFFVLVVLKGIFFYGNDYLMARVGHQVAFRLRNALYQRLVSAPLGTLRAERSGDLMTRVTDDVRVWQNAIASMANILRAITVITVFMSVMLIQSFRMTLFALLLLPLLAYLITSIGARIRKTSTEIQHRSADIHSQLKETFFGIKIIKSFTAEPAEMERFRAMNWSQYGSAMRRARLAAFLPPAIECLSAVGIAAVFGLGCWEVITGALSTGEFIGYIAMVALMLKPMKTIGGVNTALQQCLASAERIFYVFDLRTESRVENASELRNVRGDVAFHNVSFAYHQEPTLKDITFEAKQGEVIALVGPSGSGKTTLLNLLLRFYDVGTGTIAIDGTRIGEVTLASLRRNIALVPQDTFLFDGTILENIGYGYPGASREAIISAARQANAHDFISKMPRGYDTPIGEAGTRLSGGEQQRLSIARALLKDAPILVLDEATSSLDTHSEALIQKSLANLMAGRTSFIIAHRLSTVVRADKILVLRDGEIVETGTHETLLAAGGLYQKLCEMQFGV